MMLYHGGVGMDLPPRTLWESSSVTVCRTLAGRICLPPMVYSAAVSVEPQLSMAI